MWDRGRARYELIEAYDTFVHSEDGSIEWQETMRIILL